MVEDLSTLSLKAFSMDSLCGYRFDSRRNVFIAALVSISICVVSLYLKDLRDDSSSLPAPAVVQVRENIFSSLPSKPGPKCVGLSLHEELDEMLSDFEQVFLLMLPKAAGISLGAFSSACFNSTDAGIYSPESTYFRDSASPPTLLASHIVKLETLLKIVKHATKKTLIVMTYREETSRYLSGIRHVLAARTCFLGKKEGHVLDMSETNGTTWCTVSEDYAMKIIKERQAEIGIGVPEHLTCDFYQSMVSNAPNFMFVDFSRASELQKILAKHYCPELMAQPMKYNMASQSTTRVRLRLKNGEEVELTEWLQAKKNVLEFATDARANATCQATTRYMEDELNRCGSQSMQVTPEDILKWGIH